MIVKKIFKISRLVSEVINLETTYIANLDFQVLENEYLLVKSCRFSIATAGDTPAGEQGDRFIIALARDCKKRNLGIEHFDKFSVFDKGIVGFKDNKSNKGVSKNWYSGEINIERDKQDAEHLALVCFFESLPAGNQVNLQVEVEVDVKKLTTAKRSEFLELSNERSCDITTKLPGIIAI